MRHIGQAMAATLALLSVHPGILASGKGARTMASALDFKTKTLEGKDVDLSIYKGKVVLIVNVASRCGFTPQYKPLQALHEKYKDQGLVVIGVPANDFGKQEPGTDPEIATFCQRNYGVSFLMLTKVPTVLGEGASPLYKFLTSKEQDPKFAGDVKWNFTKFLIDRKGDVVGRFEPKVAPDSEELTQAVERALAEK